MNLVYVDEAGDDGHPRTSSPLFVLSAIWIREEEWRESFQKVEACRHDLRKLFGFPGTLELHTREFLLNKNPYGELRMGNEERVGMIGFCCKFLSRLPVRLMNVCIHKAQIKEPHFDVMESALASLLAWMEHEGRSDRRIGDQNRNQGRFLVITDEGRLGKMRAVARKMQRRGVSSSGRGDGAGSGGIERMVEDPLAKDSKESYFIQFADMMACIVYLHCIIRLKAGIFSHRMPPQLDESRLGDWLALLKLNPALETGPEGARGVVILPK